mgnify:CR=1 FL=1
MRTNGFEMCGVRGADGGGGEVGGPEGVEEVVEGGLDKQIAIMGVMGRLGFELLKPE